MQKEIEGSNNSINIMGALMKRGVWRLNVGCHLTCKQLRFMDKV